MFIYFRPDLKNKAQKNRKQISTPEKKIWYEILSNKKLGYKFLRQKPIEIYILDFYCSKLKLAIEIDGDTHSFQEQYDKNRTQILQKKHNIKVIRYTNHEVMKNIQGVYEDLVEKIKQREKEVSI